MPIYDYQCRRCAKRFEMLVKPDETPDCPKCGAADPVRMFPFSAGVSTVKTRERAMTGARRKAGAEKKEKDHAHAEYVRKHNEDHGG
ncbi:MAG: zinc ribbon domain-containing protein [Pseudomonadota bacterium]